MNNFETSATDSKPRKIHEELKNDAVIRNVIDWIEDACYDDLTYDSFELKKYHKHLMRLQIHKGILMRQFFDEIGKISNSQICVPKRLRKEVIYRTQNSPTGGHLGIVRTAKEVRKRFYFPGFSENMTYYINNWLSCSTLKRVTKIQLHPPLQPISSEHIFPGDMMQLDLVGPFQSPVYK